MGSYLLSLKTAAGVLASAAAVGLAAPGAAAFVLAGAPRAYGVLCACLTPPYLYFVVNGIIISIVASSRLHKAMTSAPAPVPAVVAPAGHGVDEEAFFATALHEDAAPVVFGGLVEAEVVRSQQRRRSEPREVAAVFSQQLGEQRWSATRVVVPGGLGKTSEVVQPMFEETLESTWNTIKKSDAWVDLNCSQSRSKEEALAATPALIPASSPPHLAAPPCASVEEDEVRLKLSAPTPTLYGGVKEVKKKAAAAVEDEEDVISRLQPLSLNRPAAAAAIEKPMISSRFGQPHERSTRLGITEGTATFNISRDKSKGAGQTNYTSRNGYAAGKALGVARVKRDETLESTWKTITDGRAVPLARHLKKSDTWGDSHVHHEPAAAGIAVTLKSKTFNLDRSGRPPTGAGTAPPGGGRKLHKEASVGQEDLNRRVEAFINKVNQDMRLQREESIQHYIEMIGRGSH